jgi:predicted NBD/HSP70 family sugar kinase
MNKVSTKHRIRKNRILRELFDRGPLSLAELSRITGLTLPMVSRIASELRKEEVIGSQEEKKPSGAGRPPIVASLKGDAGVVAGIDLGRRNASLVLLGLDGRVVAERMLLSPPPDDDRAINTFILRELERLLERGSAPRSRLRGLGVALPGMVGKAGEREVPGGSTPPRGGGARLADVREQVGVPLFVEHDVIAMALGEFWFGAAKGERHALCINIGWGLGLALILDGRLFYGRDGYAGELGHIEAVPGGDLCHCGKQGCLETVASGMAIGHEARKQLSAGASSLLTRMVNGDLARVDAELVVSAARDGDALSLGLLEEAGRRLGEGVGTLINLFNPAAVIFGGRVAQAGELLLDPLRGAALRHSLMQSAAGVDFRIAALGPGGGARGVAMLALRDLFDVEHLNPQAFV